MSALSLDAELARLRAHAEALPYPPLALRRALLGQLHAALLARRDALASAIGSDFGHRPRHESLLTDLVPSLRLIHYYQRRLRALMRPRWRRVGWIFWPASARLLPQPLGVVGIISPWNFPLNLAMAPLACALAAGNRVMLKLSEFTPATNQQIRELLAAAGLTEWVTVVEGDGAVAAAFAALPFDHLLFTGSTAVGRKVMAAAAANLTPLTLELGGKSPAIIAPDADLRVAAERLLFGKCVNAGQICVAPDYLLVPRAQLQRMVEQLVAVYNQRYPDVARNPDMASIIHDGHYQRLQALLADALSHGAELRACQPVNGDSALPRRMALHLLWHVSDEMQVMQEEIFGPLLPLLPYDQIDEALAYVRERPRPLASYLFSNDEALISRVSHELHAGALVVNDTLLHVAMDDLPFGGIGPSGMGHYHGPEGFFTFSKLKPVVRQRRLAATIMVQAPYQRWYHRLLFWLVLR